ncbi:MAG: carbon-nitrogen hydrolase family protein [Candidatus Aminicenantes bacterium]|nr:carbon-nitrogen hydrolase family protein [Candidatus Aminicenantes bacterium]
MTNRSASVKVAVVQAAPVMFNLEKTIEKVCELIGESATNGAEFILFPEAFIPAYPRGLSFGMKVGGRTDEGRKLWQRYWNNSVEIPGPAIKKIGEYAKKHGVYVAIGVIEKDSDFSKGTLYCTLLYFGKDGEILGKHRKLKPTGSERLIWGEGDGSTLTVVDTELGKIGGLICWENYMPMARMAIYGKGVEIYIAPTADQRERWQATMRHIALEGRCFVLGCNQFVTKDMYPPDLELIEELENMPDILCNGGSVIVSPQGEVIEGPLNDKEGILYADLDMGEVVRGKLDFDVTGHYARSDIFKLIVNEDPQLPVEKAF